MSERLKYEIKSADVMQLLVDNGFILANTLPGVWVVESPKDISNSQARKLISACINLHKTSKDLFKVQSKYNYIVDMINNINIVR